MPTAFFLSELYDFYFMCIKQSTKVYVLCT